MTPHARPTILAGGGAALLAILPVLAARHLPLLDAPAHEARLAVLWNILVAGRGSEYYDFAGFYLPNVAFDLIGLGLMPFAGPETAGRITFAFAMLITLGGVWALNRVAIGRWSLWPLLATLLVYNLTSILGFFSYTIGLGLVSWFLCGRLKLRSAAIWRHAFGAVAALILLFCHAFDFGIYATMVAGFVAADLLQRRISWTGALLSAAELVPALVVFAFMPTAGAGHIGFAGNSVGEKLFGLFKSVTSGSMTGDAAFGIAAASFIVLVIMAGRARIGLGFALGMAGLAVLYLILPDKLASGSYVDKRMPIAIALMLLSGLDLQVRPGRTATVLTVLVAAALIVRQGAIAVLWRSFDPMIDRFAAALNRLPAGAVIFQAECEPDAHDITAVYRERQPSMTHLPAMAAFADTRFVAHSWAVRGQQTIAVREPWRAYYDLEETFGSSSCTTDSYRDEVRRIGALEASQAAFPALYLVLIRPPRSGSIADVAQLADSGPGFEIYLIGAQPAVP